MIDDRSRSQTLVSGQLSFGAQSMKVRVRDLSEGGAKIECPQPIKPGTRVTLDTSKVGEVSGRIVWADENGRAGIDFDKPVKLSFDAAPVKLREPKISAHRRSSLAPEHTRHAARPEDWR